MKFYDINNDELNYYPIEIYEAEDGEWAKSADAEQAAKDAVGAAKRLQQEIVRWKRQAEDWNVQEDPGMQYAQTIIERYEGGKDVEKV